MTSLPAERLTVSRLVELIREVVESNFFAVTVEGEVSNFVITSYSIHYTKLYDPRNMTARSCPWESLRVKYQCPEAGMEKLETSPSTVTAKKLLSTTFV